MQFYSSFRALQSISFSCSIPKPVTDEKNRCGISFGKVCSISFICSSSIISDLDMVSIRFLSSNSGLYRSSSPSKIFVIAHDVVTIGSHHKKKDRVTFYMP